MKRQEVKLLGDVLQQVLQENRFFEKLNETRVLELWYEVSGEVVSKHTKDLFIKNRVLFVKVDSPALRSDLMMKITELKNILNSKVGCEVIMDIKLLG